MEGTAEEVAQCKALALRARQADADHPARPFFELVLAFAEFRRGDLEATQQALDRIGADSPHWNLVIPQELLQAMVHHRQSHAAKAQMALARASKRMEHEAPPVATGVWHDLLICQILRRECNALLRIAKSD
jgi:hypothetical protein